MVRKVWKTIGKGTRKRETGEKEGRLRERCKEGKGKKRATCDAKSEM